MFTQTASMADFGIHLSEIDDGSINLLTFEGNEQISGLFEYCIEIFTKDKALDSSLILNKPATITFIRGDEEPGKVNGIITHFEQNGIYDEYAFYKIVLSPRLWSLNLIFQNVVYQNLDITELIKSIMENSNLTGSDYKIDLMNTYPKNEFVVQYRETNLDFLNRRLEHYGIYYYFEHKSDKDVVVFTDANNKLPEAELNDPIDFNLNKDHLPDRESIQDINCREKMVTGTVQLKDYNYEFPEKQLMAQSQIKSEAPGLYYDFGDNFPDINEARFLAKIRNQEIISRSKVFFGTSDCRLFRAGSRFKLSKHFREDWNDEYVITKTKYTGDQNELFNLLQRSDKYKPTYECKFEAIPTSIEFRPERKTVIPKITGIMSSKIESGSGDEYAFLDDQGRYKAKLPFDLSDKTNGTATLPIRLLQNYSGSDYGIHFPNHENTELLWSCVDGDPDRPVGLGTIPNPSNASPVNSKNKMQNIIRTAAGNEIILNDKTKESQIIVNTTDANNMIFDDKDDKIQISTTGNHQVKMDDKNQNITVQTKDGHLLILDDKNTKITVQSKNGHMICIDDGSGGENITIADSSGENIFVIDISNSKLVIKTENGNIDLHAPNGTIDVKATEFNLETTGDTSLKAANINSQADQDIKVKASNITEEATMDFKQKGMNIKSEASMDHKIKGLNVTSEAGVNQQVKGTMITVQSSGPNTIKGMPVMIN